MRRLSAIALSVAVAACTLWLFVMASNSAWQGSVASSAPNLALGESARGVRTLVVRDNRLALRASADEIAVRRPKAFGPFRIGFLRSVAARGVVVDTFEETRSQSRPLEPAFPVMEALAHLLPRSAVRKLVKAEAEGFSFTRYCGGQASFAIRARRCETTAIQNGLICRAGSLRSDGRETHFRTAMFADGAWQVDGKQWP